MTKEEAVKILSESIHEGSKVSWDKIVEAVHLSIEALSQPSLPSNLDEAAKEYCKDEMNYDDSLYFHRMYLSQIFKAGAEWMAGQGYSKEVRVWALGENETPAVFVDDVMYLPKNSFQRGDKVIVQIRKEQ